MIRFVDLETGNTFNGSDPYVFWFDNEQSTNIIYSKPICFINDSETVDISIEQNDIFKLINMNQLENTDNYYDINTLYVGGSLKSKGIKYDIDDKSSCYIHIIYFTCRSSYDGEYKCKFYINKEPYNIGADFYGENESLYINLSNNGINIPDGIQKSLYPVNVHEDNRDNIILNRKWKELLSNYWDIVANKGSYKSLYNSLNWFEYGDMLRLCELWKYDNCGIKYEVQDLQSSLKSKYNEFKNNFAKTTYIALYCSLNKIKKEGDKILYDDDKNPVLEKISHMWSDEDLSLKMSLLGSFYETYFMPIHLDLIHSTIENIVFANSSKLKTAAKYDRTDYIYHQRGIKCNIKDGDIFYLDKVNCYVNNNTLFKQNNYNTSGMIDKIVGVSKENVIDKHSDEELKLYATQLYSGEGCIIDFEIEIPLQKNDYIKKERIVICNESSTNINDVTAVDDYKILKNNIKFSIFVKELGDYRISLQFDSTDGYTYTKTVKFKLEDNKHYDINVYKVIHKSEDIINTLDCFDNNGNINNYINVRNLIDNQLLIQDSLYTYTCYIPTIKNNIINIPDLHKSPNDFPNDDEYKNHLKNTINGINGSNINEIRKNKINQYKGVCTNHLLIFSCSVCEIERDDNGTNVTSNFYYKDYNTGITDPDSSDIIWNNGKGYQLSYRDISVANNINNTNNVLWTKCYNVLSDHYDMKFVWKGSNNPADCKKLYLICVSKKFGFNTDLLLYYLGRKDVNALIYFKSKCMYNIVNDYNTVVYRNDNIFVPCYHELEELNAKKIQDMEHFIISDQDALCVQPAVEYSKNISEYSWEFINMSDPKQKSIKINQSIKQPFVANNTEKFLDPGYYSIKFRYKYGNKTNTITLDSAFKKI